jgi:adenosylhomocysteine nucleosidase
VNVKSETRNALGESVRWGKVLVCFAVKEEAGPFERRTRGRALRETLLTGMGARNAGGSLRAALEWEPPQLVLSCGFAGGLRPGLASGTVIFAAEGESALAKALVAAGAQAGRFHCADRVASTVAEKRALWESTRADAVEMESQIICHVCCRQNIPCAVVRVILDTAEEDLPLDFNLLMTPKQKLDNRKLAKALLKSPGKIGALLKLRKQSKAAAERLAQVLAKVL